MSHEEWLVKVEVRKDYDAKTYKIVVSVTV